MRTIVYVDGFNLYYGALKGTPWKWLDLEKLCRLLLPKDEVVMIRYFTSLVTRAPGGARGLERQQVYLRALSLSPLVRIHYGTFLSHAIWMPRADDPARSVRVISTREKGTDVALASYLLLDGFRGRYETAVLVSNDSDLAEPMILARSELGKVSGLVNPNPSRRPNRELARACSFIRRLGRWQLREAQFPARLSDQVGSFEKPAGW